MATPYAPPEWGLNGTNAFGLSLDVIRNGVLVETVSLPLDPAKSFVVAGRMEPLCDLVLHHPSLSRIHAVLQFDAHGALFVQDMKSTHGTFVNKKRLAPLQFQRLHVGDLLVFGESTRKYAVCGPDELRPEEPDMAKLRAKIEASKQAQKQRDEREAAGATWGFREDAEEEDDEDSDDEETSKCDSKNDADLPEYLRGIKERGRTAYESSVQASDVSDKDQKLFTQLQTKIRKMENLETEKARILAKQNDLQGLSDGQQKTLDRNTARIETLAAEIAELEDRIHARNAQRDESRAANNRARAGRTSAKSTESAYAYDSDEDDFYDRTSANQQKLRERKQQAEVKTTAKATPAAKSEVLTAEIIERKIQLLENDLKELNADYARVEADGATGEKRRSSTEELDALEAFMQSTANELHTKELARLRTRRDEVEKELTKQRQLLAIAMPALRQEQPASAHSTLPPARPQESRSSSNAKAAEGLKPTTKISPTEPVAVDPKEPKARVDVVDELQEETEKRKETDIPALKPTAPPPKKRRAMGPTLPPPSAAPATAGDGSTLEGGDRVWVPPANQTGDGRTKLNDKYGY